MRISIIIPVYDEATALPAMLEHIRDLPVEVVFVDGGSDDTTAALLRASGRCWFVAGKGRARQMNAGARAVSGDVLLFLHADTRLPRGGLETIRNAVRGGAVAGSFDVRLDSCRPLLRLIGRMINVRSRVTGISSGDQAQWVRRDVFSEIGGFRSLPLFEDLDLVRRLRRRGKVVRLRGPVTTSARRWEIGGPWRTVLRMWTLRSLYTLGISPWRLARHYQVAR